MHANLRIFIHFSHFLVHIWSCRDGDSYNNHYLVDQSIPCSRENENENPWFNFSSTYQQEQPNEQQLSTLYSSLQSPASYGGFQGLSAGSNPNYYRNSSTSTLDLLSSSSFSSSMGYNLQAAHRHMDFLSNYSSGFNKNRAVFGYAHQNHHEHVQDSMNNNNSPSNSSNKVCIFFSCSSYSCLLILSSY